MGMQAKRTASKSVKLQRPDEGRRVQSLPFGTSLPASDTDSMMKGRSLEHRRKCVSAAAPDPNYARACRHQENWQPRQGLKRQFSTPEHPTCLHDDTGTAGGVVACVGGSGRMHCLDRHPRGSIPRASPLLPAGMRTGKKHLAESFSTCSPASIVSAITWLREWC